MQLLKKSCLLVLGLAMLVLARPMSVLAATADPVLEWIGIMNDTVLAGGTNPLVTSRVVALVSASLFDAVNGIDGRLQPSGEPRCDSILAHGGAVSHYHSSALGGDCGLRAVP